MAKATTQNSKFPPIWKYTSPSCSLDVHITILSHYVVVSVSIMSAFWLKQTQRPAVSSLSIFYPIFFFLWAGEWAHCWCSVLWNERALALAEGLVFIWKAEVKRSSLSESFMLCRNLGSQWDRQANLSAQIVPCSLREEHMLGVIAIPLGLSCCLFFSLSL